MNRHPEIASNPATTRELVAFHEQRARVYASLAAALRERPCAAAVVRCHDAGAPSRLSSGVRGDTPAAEILALASLASRTAAALTAGDLPEAAALNELQVRFLDEHARACLARLAGEIADSPDGLHASVGLRLRAILASDLRLLAGRADLATGA